MLKRNQMLCFGGFCAFVLVAISNRWFGFGSATTVRAGGRGVFTTPQSSGLSELSPPADLACDTYRSQIDILQGALKSERTLIASLREQIAAMQSAASLRSEDRPPPARSASPLMLPPAPVFHQPVVSGGPMQAQAQPPSPLRVAAVSSLSWDPLSGPPALNAEQRTALVALPQGVEYYKPGFAPMRTLTSTAHADKSLDCIALWKKYMVIPHNSWGNLPPDLRESWNNQDCNRVSSDQLQRMLDTWSVQYGHPGEDIRKRKVIEIAREVWGYESPFINPWIEDKIAHIFAKLPDGVLDFRESFQLKLWDQLKLFAEERRQMAPFNPNNEYAGLDQYVLYSLIRHLRPRRVLEIGAGTSSYTVVKALRRNRQESGEENIHWCIEPYRADTLDQMHILGIADHTTVIEKTAQETPISVYQQLEPGDVLFIDSSHVTAPHGDTVFELNVLLPQLPVGVIVHIHDIFLPYDYPKDWLMDTYRPYTEQNMLAAFLYGNRDWEIVWSTRKWMYERPELFRPVMPEDQINGGNFWIRKIA